MGVAVEDSRSRQDIDELGEPTDPTESQWEQYLAGSLVAEGQCQIGLTLPIKERGCMGSR